MDGEQAHRVIIILGGGEGGWGMLPDPIDVLSMPTLSAKLPPQKI